MHFSFLRDELKFKRNPPPIKPKCGAALWPQRLKSASLQSSRIIWGHLELPQSPSVPAARFFSQNNRLKRHKIPHFVSLKAHLIHGHPFALPGEKKKKPEETLRASLQPEQIVFHHLSWWILRRRRSSQPEYSGLQANHRNPLGNIISFFFVSQEGYWAIHTVTS